MNLFRHRYALRLWLLTLLAWVSAGSAALVHEYTVSHVICADHGEVVELGPGHQDVIAQAGHPTARDAPLGADQHDHGCALPAMPTPPDVLPNFTMPAVHFVAFWPTQSVVSLRAARPPPLRYAPKTSPPVSG
jgi:hypothetical protein